MNRSRGRKNVDSRTGRKFTPEYNPNRYRPQPRGEQVVYRFSMKLWNRQREVIFDCGQQKLNRAQAKTLTQDAFSDRGVFADDLKGKQHLFCRRMLKGGEKGAIAFAGYAFVYDSEKNTVQVKQLPNPVNNKNHYSAADVRRIRAKDSQQALELDLEELEMIV